MASLQQVVEQLALLAASGTNGTTGANASSATSGPRGPIELLTTIYKMLFSASALRDWAVLLVIGSFFETARRLLSTLWYRLINAFFVTAVFSDDDVSFQWIMFWLSRQPSWKGARNVQISTSNFDLFAVHFDPSSDSSASSRKVTYLPAVSESYNLWYKRSWIKIVRTAETNNNGWSMREYLTMSIMTRDHAVLAEILEQAKTEYAEAQKDNISIFVSDRYNISGNGWRELATRPKRPLNSIILDPGITELVVEDVRDFLDSKEWYAERGIPFRRGYLLYGAPGSGKTSLIHSIAGEFGLNVYIISLSRSGMDDIGLSELISTLPERCIALMEDIDAAFHHGLSRESPQAATPQSPVDSDQPPGGPPGPPASSGNRVSLSGLLNALDGIGAQEGRVLFATTNKYSSLDPALCRPGRMDLHVEFKLASRMQAEELFKRFYAPPLSSGIPTTRAGEYKCHNGQADLKKNLDPKDLIDLSEPHAPSTSPLPPSPPSSPTLHSPSSASEIIQEKEDSVSKPPLYVGISHRARGPALSYDRVESLAVQFSQAIPEREMSMASLQGFLMMYKTRPFVAVAEVGAWVEKQMSERKKLAAESEGETKT